MRSTSGAANLRSHLRPSELGVAASVKHANG